MESPEGERLAFASITHEDPDAALRAVRRTLHSAPVMTGMWGRGFGRDIGHWIVVVGYDAGELLYLNPWCLRREERRLSLQAFSRHWASYGVFLKHPCRCAR